MCDALLHCNLRMSQERARNLFRYIDFNQDQLVDYEEFAHAFKGNVAQDPTHSGYDVLRQCLTWKIGVFF